MAVGLALIVASALAQDPAPCLGGRLVTGIQLQVGAPGHSGTIPFSQINNLAGGDVLHYAPQSLPRAWRRSARVAALLVPTAYDASSRLTVFSAHADKDAAWTVPVSTAAVAFLFGPHGLNPGKTRQLLTQHPDLTAHFIAYAEQSSRVEALVALLARYENSPPGTLDLNQMLQQYSHEYGVDLPKVNPALPPDQVAAELLAAISPPTAQPGPSPHADLAAGSTSTASALAAIYFGPVMGLATDTLPLFRALRSSMFPGTQFQGAFAQPAADGERLCAANTAPPPNQHTVYIWMTNLPAGSAPSVRLAKAAAVTLPADEKSRLLVTCDSVAQLRDLSRARQWELQPAAGAAVPVPVEVATGATTDTLTLDLTHSKLPPGRYQLQAQWDWTPVRVAGAITLQAPSGLAGARLSSADAARLVADSGTVAVTLTGANFSLVNQVELVGSASVPAPAYTLAGDGQSLTLQLDTGKLEPGSYQLRLLQSAGPARDLRLTILPPDPSLRSFSANLEGGRQRVRLRGAYLERIARLASPGAVITLAPVHDPARDLDQRDATVRLRAGAQAGQNLPVDIYVAGAAHPLSAGANLLVLPPRPRIAAVQQSVNAGQTVALLPGELPENATVNFALTILHAPAAPAMRLRCQSSDEQIQSVTLHPGVSSPTAELDADGGGQFYLALVPGKIGAPGCRLELVVDDAEAGASSPHTLGRVVLLPHIQSFTLSNQSPAPGEFSGELSGDNLQLIAKTGWNPTTGIPVASVPMRVSATSPTQTLAIAMPWPPPSPHAPLYIWLRGESRGRATTVVP